MIDRELVTQYIEEKIAGTDFFIVVLEIDAGNNIVVSLDSDSSIGIEDCVEVSSYVEEKLNRQEANFSLQVGTPGVNNPLVLPRQYRKNTGRQVVVLTHEGEKYKGKLLSANNEKFTIAFSKKVKDNGKKNKRKQTTHRTFSYSEIKSTKVVVSFKQ